ncbi:hypothetical protein LguiA_029669 [Lonicera macranthoides]
MVTQIKEEEPPSSSSSYPAGDPSNNHRPHGWKYDVFLSFHGEDTRKTFVDHLYYALHHRGIFTFKDDERLERGRSIAPELLQAIELSRFAIIVFSKNYASSSWCLDELAKIMDCLNNNNNKFMAAQLTVIPVFYDVQPSDVRKQEGHFGEMFSKHDSDRVQIWRQALRDTANLSGWDLKNVANGHEAKCIDIVVKDIRSKLPHTILSVDEPLVGMKCRIEEVIALLDAESNVVRTVGIWGMSGIGKTTLARAVFDKISHRFEVACFLYNVGEVSRKDGLERLQEQLLSKALMVDDLQIMNVYEGINLSKSLRFKCVFLVLDDVDHLDQLEVLAGTHCLFGPRSRIIITTRDRHLLVARGVDETYEVRLLNDDEAIQLFNWKAFKGIRPTEDFVRLSDQVIHFSGGLPLALKVLGSTLCGENFAFWKDSLEKLSKEGPDGDILKKFKISFDGLEKKVQETFLDIACFFEGQEKERVSRILDSCDFYPDYSIPILVHKSLIYVSEENKLCMHQLIQEMGRHIDREKPRRLWLFDDVVRVLKSSTGTKNIEGILLHPQRERKHIDIAIEAFREMHKLRLLEVHNVWTPRVPDYLPSQLRWLIWEKFPSKSLPPRFEADNLVGLQLYCSSIERPWSGEKMMEKLKYIDLSYSQKLIRTPDFTSTPNLERLILQGCKSLVEVHRSVGFLKKLACLDLEGCSNLKSLPNSIHSESLETFVLSGCHKIKKFPEISVIMELLSVLFLDETTVRELPSSIEHFPNLVLINLVDCNNLVNLPSSVCKFKHLKELLLSNCSKFDKLPEDLGYLESLEELYLDKTAIKEIPSSIEHLSRLVWLSLTDCKNLLSLPSAICKLKCLEYLQLSGCSELETLPEELSSLGCLTTLNLDGTAITRLPLSNGSLNNLYFLSCCKIPQSSSSPFQFLFPLKRKQQEDSTTSLVLLSVSGLHSLYHLDVSGCNMFDGAIPSDLESMCSLTTLYLNGNSFTNIPSLTQLSQLSRLFLDGCKMLHALPELPSSIEALSANDCPSLRLFADQFTNSNKVRAVSFRNCLQLLKEEANGESKNIASTLWQHMIQRSRVASQLLHILLPGRDIPEWFCKQTTGTSISLKLPSNWSRDNFEGFGICVAFDPTYKAFYGRRKNIASVGVEITVRTCTNREYRLPVIPNITGEYKNISKEHVCLVNKSFVDLHDLCDLNDWCEIEVSIKNSSPNAAVLKKWGMGLIPKSRGVYIESYDKDDEDVV